MSNIQTGWIPFDERTRDMQEVHDLVMKSIPKIAFGAVRDTPPVGTKVLLTDTWKDPLTIQKLGKPYTGTHQLTGSCVWAGGQNAAFTRALLDVLSKGDPEKLVFPNCLPNYGRSRLMAGMRGRGEGSLGSTFIKSLADDGSGDLDLSQTKPQSTDDGWIFGESTELKYSDGGNLPPDEVSEGKKHPFKCTVQINSAAEVREVILSKNPCTRASILFVNPNTAQVRNGKLVGQYNGRGGHQESWLGYMHDEDGEWFWEQNQWGLKVYGSDPAGGPLGGCWISFNDVDRFCKSGDSEVFAILDYESYQRLTFKWES